MQELRPYQLDAIARLRQAFRDGHRRVLLTAPTGSGKSTMAAEIVRGATERKHSVLAVAHRRELITQLADRFRLNGVASGIIMAGERPEASAVQIGSIQTLTRRNAPPADILICDEAHHASAASYLRLFDKYPEAHVIGLTATPWRMNGKGLADVFNHNVVACEPRELISSGWLCGYTGYAFEAPNLSGVGTSAGDYQAAGLELAYEKQKIYADILGRWNKYAFGHSTIIFCSTVAGSQQLAQRFVSSGISAEHVDHETPVAQRDLAISRFRTGGTRVLCNVGLLTEGIDVPNCSAVVMARPTKSLALYLQMVGRALRPDGLADGRNKEKVALLLDHAGNVVRHGLPDARRDYALVPGKHSVASVRTCPQCLSIREQSQLRCSVCGMDSERVASGAREGPELVEEAIDVPLNKAAARREQLAEFEKLMELAKKRGFKPGWAVRQWVNLHPKAPKPWGKYRKLVSKETRTWYPE